MSSSSSPPQPQPPQRLRSLLSWQTNRVGTVGTRLTSQRMPLSSRADYAVLATLDEFGRLSQAELGRHLGLDRNDVSTVVARLEKRGAVTRKPDPTHQRRNIVTITRRGSTVLDELQVHADAVQDELFSGLDPHERTTLTRLLAKVLSSHLDEPPT